MLLSIVFLVAIFFIPALIALRMGLKGIKRVQFELPELLVLPLVLTPTILTALYLKPIAAVAVGIYHLSFALCFWVRGTRERWMSAINLLGGVLFGSIALFIWGMILLYAVGGIGQD